MCLMVAVAAGCTAEPAPAKDESKRLGIVDAKGREWDVTHAQREYGMEPKYFNFGIGVGAIPSVDDPRVLEVGDPGYPADDDTMRVFEVNHNGEQRAYPVGELTRHEVFNDVCPGSSHRYLAVSY